MSRQLVRLLRKWPLPVASSPSLLLASHGGYDLRMEASTSSSSLSSDAVHRLRSICNVLSLTSTNDQWAVAGKTFKELFTDAEATVRTDLLIYLANNFGIDHGTLENAISLYQRNSSATNEVKRAATPLYQLLFQAVGNRKEGIKTICDLRAHILNVLEGADKTENSLRRVEETCRELLTTWFCLSNLKLERLTWQSPADILHKVAKYEAVHPVAGLTDLQRRVGPSRRCFLFTHEAMPREPLVVVHIALTDQVADNIQAIVKSDETDEKADQRATAAIYYSISSTQRGLTGIDLGNLLIKGVVRELERDLPSVRTHATLSPIPGFRAWLLRSLRGNSEYGDVMEDWVVEAMRGIHGEEMTAAEARSTLLQSLTASRLQTGAATNFRQTCEQIMLKIDHVEHLRDILMKMCAIYLLKAKKNGYAVNPVANFHIRNGAEVYRLNWAADTSVRGMERSFGIMVNYRYNLLDLHKNSDNYTIQKEIAADRQVLDLLE